jgi:hypothetical protein
MREMLTVGQLARQSGHPGHRVRYNLERALLDRLVGRSSGALAYEVADRR